MPPTVVAMILAYALGPGVPAGSLGLDEQCIMAHNVVRAAAGVPTLVWSDRLAAVAQEWADRLILSGVLEHRPDSPYGENLLDVRGTSFTPGQAIAVWAAEARDYDYSANACRGTCGHYTQLVWRGTTRVGCAVGRAGNREVWVCEYDPPGNYLGERPY